MARPLYHREKPGTHCIGGWVGPRAGLDGCGKSRPTRIRYPDGPACSKSLYTLSYPGHEPLWAQHIIIFSNFEVSLPSFLLSRNGSHTGQARHPTWWYAIMHQLHQLAQSAFHDLSRALTTGITSYSVTLLEFSAFLTSDRTLCSRGQTYCVVGMRHGRQPIGNDLKGSGCDVIQLTPRHVPGLRRAVRASHVPAIFRTRYLWMCHTIVQADIHRYAR
jgi:hypothetical protein